MAIRPDKKNTVALWWQENRLDVRGETIVCYRGYDMSSSNAKPRWHSRLARQRFLQDAVHEI